MYEANKYDGKKELQELLKKLPHIPTNTEIVEKTGLSKGSISDIMNGKRIPTEKFVLAFKKGFKIIDIDTETKNPPEDRNGLNLQEQNLFLLKEIDFYKETIKELLKNINSNK